MTNDKMSNDEAMTKSEERAPRFFRHLVIRISSFATTSRRRSTSWHGSQIVFELPYILLRLDRRREARAGGGHRLLVNAICNVASHAYTGVLHLHQTYG